MATVTIQNPLDLPGVPRLEKGQTTTHRQVCTHDGPLVINSREEIAQVIGGYCAGRDGVIPADQATPRNNSQGALS
jgi:hypothetical protein